MKTAINSCYYINIFYTIYQPLNLHIHKPGLKDLYGGYFKGFIISQRYYVHMSLQEIGYTHLKISEGMTSLLQLSGLLARMCMKASTDNVN